MARSRRAWSRTRNGRITAPATPTGVHQRATLMLDAAGGARTEITDIPLPGPPDHGAAEIEYRDPNGEAQTVSNSMTIWPAQAAARNPRRTNGIRRAARTFTSRWSISRASRPPARRCASHCSAARPIRTVKRLVGGFYAYENTTETRKAGELCAGTTDRSRLFDCGAKPALTGSVVVQAASPTTPAIPATRTPKFTSPAEEQRDGSPATTMTGWTCCRRSRATSPARPRACRCGCRSARRPCWSRSSARESSRRRCSR